MKKISYYNSRGQLYAKVPASSYREDGKVKKRNDGIYLGRVIDEARNVFYSSKRGIFTYDPVTNAFGHADETYTRALPKDHRKKQKVSLDLGTLILYMNLSIPVVMTMSSIHFLIGIRIRSTQ